MSNDSTAQLIFNVKDMLWRRYLSVKRNQPVSSFPEAEYVTQTVEEINDTASSDEDTVYMTPDPQTEMPATRPSASLTSQESPALTTDSNSRLEEETVLPEVETESAITVTVAEVVPVEPPTEDKIPVAIRKKTVSLAKPVSAANTIQEEEPEAQKSGFQTSTTTKEEVINGIQSPKWFRSFIESKSTRQCMQSLKPENAFPTISKEETLQLICKVKEKKTYNPSLIQLPGFPLQIDRKIYSEDSFESKEITSDKALESIKAGKELVFNKGQIRVIYDELVVLYDNLLVHMSKAGVVSKIDLSEPITESEKVIVGADIKVTVKQVPQEGVVRSKVDKQIEIQHTDYDAPTKSKAKISFSDGKVLFETGNKEIDAAGNALFTEISEWLAADSQIVEASYGGAVQRVVATSESCMCKIDSDPKKTFPTISEKIVVPKISSATKANIKKINETTLKNAPAFQSEKNIGSIDIEKTLITGYPEELMQDGNSVLFAGNWIPIKDYGKFVLESVENYYWPSMGHDDVFELPLGGVFSQRDFDFENMKFCLHHSKYGLGHGVRAFLASYKNKTETSTHFMIGHLDDNPANDIHIVQLVDISNKAWHAGTFNLKTIGIDFAIPKSYGKVRNTIAIGPRWVPNISDALIEAAFLLMYEIWRVILGKKGFPKPFIPQDITVKEDWLINVALVELDLIDEGAAIIGHFQQRYRYRWDPGYIWPQLIEIYNSYNSAEQKPLDFRLAQRFDINEDIDFLIETFGFGKDPTMLTKFNALVDEEENFDFYQNVFSSKFSDMHDLIHEDYTALGTVLSDGTPFKALSCSLWKKQKAKPKGRKVYSEGLVGNNLIYLGLGGLFKQDASFKKWLNFLAQVSERKQPSLEEDKQRISSIQILLDGLGKMKIEFPDFKPEYAKLKIEKKEIVFFHHVPNTKNIPYLDAKTRPGICLSSNIYLKSTNSTTLMGAPIFNEFVYPDPGMFFEEEKILKHVSYPEVSESNKTWFGIWASSQVGGEEKVRRPDNHKTYRGRYYEPTIAVLTFDAPPLYYKDKKSKDWFDKENVTHLHPVMQIEFINIKDIYFAKKFDILEKEKASAKQNQNQLAINLKAAKK